jgi:hypothetical protein
VNGCTVQHAMQMKSYMANCCSQLWNTSMLTCVFEFSTTKFVLSNEYCGLFPTGVKRPVREADHSPPTNTEVFPPRRPGFKPGSGHVGICDGQKWRWSRFSPRRISVSPANLHSICFSTIIFTITRGWHNRPGVAAVPIASQARIK